MKNRTRQVLFESIGTLKRMEMRRIGYKLLISVFAFAVSLDVLSTHLIANPLFSQGIPISKIASMENNPIVSTLWVWADSIFPGELLDFAIKVELAGVVLKLFLGRNRIPAAHHSFIFFRTRQAFAVPYLR